MVWNTFTFGLMSVLVSIDKTSVDTKRRTNFLCKHKHKTKWELYSNFDVLQKKI